jgi:SAM-dependent methyltransferase
MLNDTDGAASLRKLSLQVEHKIEADDEDKPLFSDDEDDANDDEATQNKKKLERKIKRKLLHKQMALWDSLFAECSTTQGKDLSKAERKAKEVQQSSLVYGEIRFDSFGLALWGKHVNLKRGGVFYDLGSGTGRAVMAAVLLHDFTKLVGIEILEGLAGAAQDILTKFNKTVRPTLSKRQQKADIKLLQGSFLEYDWSDGTYNIMHILCACVCVCSCFCVVLSFPPHTPPVTSTYIIIHTHTHTHRRPRLCQLDVL